MAWWATTAIKFYFNIFSTYIYMVIRVFEGRVAGKELQAEEQKRKQKKGGLVDLSLWYLSFHP